MNTTDTLVTGQRYDLSRMTCIGWTEGDGSGHEGYSWTEYFDADGVYRGPDQHGIEPICVTRDESIRLQLEVVAAVIGGKAWGAHLGTPRIYLPSRRDIKAWIEYPDASADDLGGGRLVVEIAPCGQTDAWYASQRRIAMESRMQTMLAATAARHDEALAEAIMVADEMTPEQIDAVASMLANGRIDEARAAIGGAA